MFTTSRRLLMMAALLFVFVMPQLGAQPIPRGAHTNLYFPHIANGGEAAARWQMRFVFDNPHATATARVDLSFWGDNGSPLAVDLRSGPSTVHTFTVPPQGSRVFRTVLSAGPTVTGWAFAGCSLPVQAVAAFRLIENGTPKYEINAEPTPLSHTFRFPVTAFTGVAVSNIYLVPMTVQGGLLNANGQVVQQAGITVPAGGHVSFVVPERFPGVGPNFEGTLEPFDSSVNPPDFLAWAVRGDSTGVLSTLPSGGYKWPSNRWDDIWLAYLTVLQAARDLDPVFSAPIRLDISPALEVNAYARGGNVVTVNLAMAELISDSPSELAWLVGHELGHIYQQRSRLNFFANPEDDADVWGLLLSLLAGYDPYAAAGTLSKMAMAADDSSLTGQFIDDLNFTDAHNSFSTRITKVFDFVQSVCTLSVEANQFCEQYKQAAHPHFPSDAPLIRSIDQERVVPPPPSGPLAH